MQNNKMYIFGHQLKLADLNYHLRGGDDFTLEIEDDGVNFQVGNSESPRRPNHSAPLMHGQTVTSDWRINLLFFSPQVKKAYLGKATTKPAQIEDKAFGVWLVERSLDFSAFNKWLGDELLRKQYFPLASPVLQAEIVHFFRSESGEQQGGVLRVLSEGENKDLLVVFDREDFYIGGVHIGESTDVVPWASGLNRSIPCFFQARLT